MNQEAKDKEALGRYLPVEAVGAVYSFIVDNKVGFRITRTRTTKLGDYRMPSPSHPRHEISVNGDLSPHVFLVVVLHEMAHLLTFNAYGRTVKPHGHEWQSSYRDLLAEYYDAGCFPSGCGPLLKRYTASIPLNRQAGQRLERWLREYDAPDGADRETTVGDLPEGVRFAIASRPHALFRVVEKRRTRYLCVDEVTGQRYLVSGSAPVTVVQ